MSPRNHPYFDNSVDDYHAMNGSSNKVYATEQNAPAKYEYIRGCPAAGVAVLPYQ